jgi:hypothetical protein
MTANIGINKIAAMIQAATDNTPNRPVRIGLELFSDVATIGLRIKQSYFAVQNMVVLSSITMRQK